MWYRVNISNILQNEGLANYLTQENKPVVQLVIDPLLNPSTPTGYQWTMGQGPNIPISTGTICIVKGIVGQITPIYYFFPLWRLEKLHREMNEEIGAYVYAPITDY